MIIVDTAFSSSRVDVIVALEKASCNEQNRQYNSTYF
jgi:hypothetical protein